MSMKFMFSSTELIDMFKDSLEISRFLTSHIIGNSWVLRTVPNTQTLWIKNQVSEEDNSPSNIWRSTPMGWTSWKCKQINSLRTPRALWNLSCWPYAMPCAWSLDKLLLFWQTITSFCSMCASKASETITKLSRRGIPKFIPTADFFHSFSWWKVKLLKNLEIQNKLPTRIPISRKSWTSSAAVATVKIKIFAFWAWRL